MSEHKESRSPLEDGANGLGRMVEGVAGLLLGPGKLGNRHDPEETVISEDVDRAIQDLGSAVGGVLLAAGEHLNRTSHGAGAEDAPADDTLPDDDTPLVHGARSLGRGLAALAGDLLGSLQSAAAAGSAGAEASTDDPGAPADDAESPHPGAEPA